MNGDDFNPENNAVYYLNGCALIMKFKDDNTLSITNCPSVFIIEYIMNNIRQIDSVSTDVLKFICSPRALQWLINDAPTMFSGGTMVSPWMLLTMRRMAAVEVGDE